MPADPADVPELTRLAEAYRHRDERGQDATGWSWMRPEYQWLDFVTTRFVLSALARHGWTAATLPRCRILEVGAGRGRFLQLLRQAGACELDGLEAIAQRADDARRLVPDARVLQGDMEQLPYPDATFDCVVQCLTFSSCLDDTFRRRAAREMLRVTKPGGCIVWVDLKAGGARADYLRGIAGAEIRELFAGAPAHVQAFGVMPEWLGALVSIKNQGLVRSLMRRVAGLRTGYWAARPITKFPFIAAAMLEHVPRATCYLGAVIEKSPSAA